MSTANYCSHQVNIQKFAKF